MSRIDKVMSEAREAYDPDNTDLSYFDLGDHRKAIQWFQGMKRKGWDCWLGSIDSDVVKGIAGKGLSTVNDVIKALDDIDGWADTNRKNYIKINNDNDIRKILDV